MSETTLDSLQIEIEASSSQATKRIDELTAALKRLQSATSGKFGNVGGQISDIGAGTTPTATRTRKTSSKKSTSLSDMKAQYNEMGKYLDELGEKYEQQLEFANASKQLHGAASDEEIRKLEELKQKLDETTGKYSELYKAIQSAKSQETLKAPSLGTADEFLEANSQIDILQRKAESLKSALDQALGEGDQAKADQLAEQYRKVTSQIEKLGQESNKTAKDVNKLKGEFRKATSPISKFTHTLGRIAYYRAIRSAIKAVTDGIKTGMDNLYEYSRITGTEFKPAMDSLATSSLYLKNSLGALAQPIVSALAPAFETLVDWIVMAINAFNQFISALSGKDVYTAAKKHAVEYKEATDAAAKSTKKFLLGIDELNIMDSPAGGAGSAAQDFGDMFEEKPIDNAIKGWADALKPFLDDIGLISAGIAGWQLTKGFLGDLENASTLMKGIKAAAVLTVQFMLSKWTMDNLLNSQDIGNQIKWGIGNVLTQGLSGYATYKLLGNKGILLSTIVGVTANLSSLILGIKEGGLSIDKDPQTWISTALTTAIGGIGGGIFLNKTFAWGGTGFLASTAITLSLVLAGINYAQIASGQWEVGGAKSTLTAIGTMAAAALGGALIGSMVFPGVGTAVGLGIGIMVGAVMNLVAIEMGSKVAYESSDFHKEMQAIVDKAQERIEVAKTIMVNIDTKYTALSDIEAEYQTYFDLVDRLFELDSVEHKTSENLATIQGYIDTINTLDLKGLDKLYIDANGHISETKENIYGVIESLKEQAKTEATYNLLVEAYKNSALASQELKDAQDELSTTSSKVDELQRKYNETLEKNKKLMGESTGAYAEHYGIAKDTGAAYAANKQEIEYMNSELSDLKRQLDDAKNAENKAKQAVDELGEASNKTKEQIGFFENELGNLNKKTEQVAPQIESAFNDIPKEWGNSAKDGMTEIKKTITNKDRINEFKTSANTIGTNISQGTYEGIKKDQPSFLKKIGGWASGILDKVKGIFGIHSPSTVFRDEVGYNLGAGVALGLESATSEIVSAAESIADSTMKVFDEISYDPNINYKALMDEAEASGNWREYIELEKTRNAKISGEGLKDYTKTYNYAYISDEFLNSFDTPYKNYERDYDYSSYSGIDYDKINSILVKNSEEIVSRMSQENQARTTTMMATISDDVEESSNNIVNAVMAIGQQIVQAVNSKDTNFTLDGKQLARAMQGYNEQATRNRGGSLVRVGG